jgi:hypothetical protein
MPAYVTVDNAANANFTVLEVEVQDYPGALGLFIWLTMHCPSGLPPAVMLVYHYSHNVLRNDHVYSAGLMRVLAWVLNGLDVVAQNAILRTGPDGVAHNTFWLSSRSGKKLKAGAAEMVMERVRDFVSYCSPKPGGENRTEFGAGPIAISNSEHPEYTVVS